MDIYIIVLLLLIMVAFLSPEIRRHKSLNTYVIISIGLILCLMASLRYYVGVDYQNYISIYNSPTRLAALREIGYIKVVELCKWIGLPFTVFSSLFSIATILLIFRFITHNSPYVYLSIIIYYSLGNYYFSTYNVVRQSLATAIVMNCLPLIANHRLVKYATIIILTGIFVHFSAIFLLVLYFIINRQYTLREKVIAILGSLILVKAINIIIGYTPYAVYLQFEAFSSSVPSTYYLISILAIITLIYSCKHPEWEKQHLLLCNLNIIVIMLIIQLFAYENTPLVMVFHRLLNYVNIIYLILLPLLCATVRHNSLRRILISAIIIIFSGLCYIALVKHGESNALVPYTSVFSAQSIP